MTNVLQTEAINGFTVRRTASTVTVLDPDGWSEANLAGAVVLEFNYGDGWVEDTGTGNVKRYNGNVMDLITEIIESLDVNGFRRIDDDYDRCIVCEAPTDLGVTCSTDCTLAAIDSQD